MKKEYFVPEIELVKTSGLDVLTESGFPYDPIWG